MKYKIGSNIYHKLYGKVKLIDYKIEEKTEYLIENIDSKTRTWINSNSFKSLPNSSIFTIIKTLKLNPEESYLIESKSGSRYWESEHELYRPMWQMIFG